MNTLLAWLITHSVFGVMVISILLDPHNLKWAFKNSAYFAITFLCVILSLNPLKAIFPRWVLIHRLNQYRQQIGVAVFSYAAIHAMCFAIRVGSIDRWLNAATKPALMSVMLVSLPIFAVLAITSAHYFKRTMGFKNWKRLHRLVYIAEAGVILHLALLGKGMLALAVFLPLVLIQLFRVANRNHLKQS